MLLIGYTQNQMSPLVMHNHVYYTNFEIRVFYHLAKKEEKKSTCMLDHVLCSSCLLQSSIPCVFQTRGYNRSCAPGSVCSNKYQKQGRGY